MYRRKQRGGAASLTNAEVKRVKVLGRALRETVREFRIAPDVATRIGLVERIAEIVEKIRELTDDNQQQLRLIREKLRSM